MALCSCGAEMLLDDIRCQSCGKRLHLDPLITSHHIKEPPVSEWARNSPEKDRKYSEESMREVREEAKRRARSKKFATSKETYRQEHRNYRFRRAFRSGIPTKVISFVLISALLTIGLNAFDRLPNDLKGIAAGIDSITEKGADAIGINSSGLATTTLFTSGDCFSKLDTSSWDKEQPENPSAYLVDVLVNTKKVAESQGYMEYRWGEGQNFAATSVRVVTPPGDDGFTRTYSWEGLSTSIRSDFISDEEFPVANGYTPNDLAYYKVFIPISQTPISVRADGTLYAEVITEDSSSKFQIGVKDGLVAGWCVSEDSEVPDPYHYQQIGLSQYKIDGLGERIINSEGKRKGIEISNEKLGQSEIFDNDLFRLAGNFSFVEITDEWPIEVSSGTVLETSCLLVILNEGDDGSGVVDSLTKYEKFDSITGDGYLGIEHDGNKGGCSFLEANYGGKRASHEWEPVF